MNTPIAAILWPEDARRDLGAVMRLLAHLELACQELGSDEAAALVAEAGQALLRTGQARKLAA
jgi:hypothetical protein